MVEMKEKGLIVFFSNLADLFACWQISGIHIFPIFLLLLLLLLLILYFLLILLLTLHNHQTCPSLPFLPPSILPDHPHHFTPPHLPFGQWVSLGRCPVECVVNASLYIQSPLLMHIHMHHFSKEARRVYHSHGPSSKRSQ